MLINIVRRAAFLAVCLIASGCSSSIEDSTVGNQVTSPTPAHAPTIKISQATAKYVGLETAIAEKRQIKVTQSLPAQVEPDIGKEVDISSRVPGRADQILVSPGQYVKQGQVLAVITSREVSDLEAQAVAVLAKLETMKAQEAREKQVYNEQVESPKALFDARRAAKEAAVKVNLDASQLRRQKLLIKERIGPEKDLVAAQAAFDQAEANLEHARANLKREEALYKNRAVLRGPYQMAQAERIRAEKELQALKSQLTFLGVDNETLKANLERGVLTGVLKIAAPADGEVSFFGAAPGEMVSADKPIFRVTDMSTMLVSADVPESEIPIAKLGKKIDVSIPGIERRFSASINYVANSVAPSTRTFSVRARLDNGDHMFKPGMFVDVTLDRANVTALAVPKSAIHSEQGSNVVFVQAANGFEKRTIEKGIEGDDYVEITSGLQPGEVVAAQGSLMLENESSNRTGTK